jgi:hypothetical protein
MRTPPLIQQPHFPLQSPDLGIALVLFLLRFEQQPEPVHHLVGQEGEREGLEERAAVRTVEIVAWWLVGVVLLRGIWVGWWMLRVQAGCGYEAAERCREEGGSLWFQTIEGPEGGHAVGVGVGERGCGFGSEYGGTLCTVLMDEVGSELLLRWRAWSLCAIRRWLSTCIACSCR